MLGSILFFPLKMESGKTCLFHRIFGGDEENLPNHIPLAERAQLMLRAYLVPFAFVWWLSLVILGMSIYYLKYKNFKLNQESQ